MADIPNPIGAFEIFPSKREKKLKKRNSLKTLSKKLAKRIFGKKSFD